VSMRNGLPIRLLFVLALLFAQQAGAVHAVHHALEDLTQHQHDKNAPHSDACEKCAAYAQLGNALNVGAFDFTPPAVTAETIPPLPFSFRSVPVLAADARAPPRSA
jgi:hypothetical protein